MTGTLWVVMRLADAVLLLAMLRMLVLRLGEWLTIALVVACHVVAHVLFPGASSERARWMFFFAVDIAAAVALAVRYTLKHHWRPGPKP